MSTLDDRALDYFYFAAQGRTWWIPFWNWFCIVFSPMTLRALVLLPIYFEFRRGRSQVGWFLIASVEASVLATELGKLLADRARPPTHMVHATGTSFPSGHALGDLVIVTSLLIVYGRFVAHQWRGVVVALGVLLIISIGVARVALNVHHPSDIVAGWALGYTWLVLCLWLVPPYRPRPTLSRTLRSRRGRNTGNTRYSETKSM